MYKQYYHFKTLPFKKSHDLGNIFLSQNYEIPLAVLVSGLDKGVILHALIGEDGAGKTFFIHYVYKHIQHGCTVGIIDCQIESSVLLLQQTLSSFGIDTKTSSSTLLLKRLREVLEAQLIENHGQPSLLIIDDANKISPEVLSSINQLLSLNRKDNLLLQIILVGNKNLQKTINTVKMQAIPEIKKILWHRVMTLTEQETQSYIRHQLKISGSSDENLFDEQACKLIYQQSKGNLKKINSLCNKALLLGIKLQVKQITPQHISEVAKPYSFLTKTSTNYPPKDRSFTLVSIKDGVIFAGVALTVFLITAPWFIPTKIPEIEKAKQIIDAHNQSNREIFISAFSRFSGIESDPLSTIGETPLNKKASQFQQTNGEALEPSHKETVELPKKESINPQIEKLLAKAEQQIIQSRLLTPENDNAYQTFQNILSRKPDEKRAIAGLHLIANRYSELSEKYFTQGDLNRSKQLVTRGLSIEPDNTNLANLNRKIDTKIKQKNQLVRDLLAQGDQKMASSKFISPRSDNAYQFFLDVLALDSSNKVAKQKINKIQTILLSKLQTAENDKNFRLAQQLSKLILSTSLAGHYLSEAYMLASEKDKFFNNKISALLAQANEQIKSKKLILPVGDNATESYREILTIKENHKLAIKGLNYIIEAQKKLAEKKLSDGNINQALVIINASVAIFPDEPTLLHLQNKISFALNEQNLKIATLNASKKQNKVKKQLRPFGNF